MEGHRGGALPSSTTGSCISGGRCIGHLGCHRAGLSGPILSAPRLATATTSQSFQKHPRITPSAAWLGNHRPKSEGGAERHNSRCRRQWSKLPIRLQHPQMFNPASHKDHVSIMIVDPISLPPADMPALEIIDAPFVDKGDRVSLQVQEPLLILAEPNSGFTLLIIERVHGILRSVALKISERLRNSVAARPCLEAQIAAPVRKFVQLRLPLHGLFRPFFRQIIRLTRNANFSMIASNHRRNALKKRVPYSRTSFPGGLNIETRRYLEPISQALQRAQQRTGRFRFYDYLGAVYRTYKQWQHLGISKKMARHLVKLRIPVMTTMRSGAWRPLDPVETTRAAPERDGAVGCRF